MGNFRSLVELIFEPAQGSNVALSLLKNASNSFSHFFQVAENFVQLTGNVAAIHPGHLRHSH